jgi:hypothetical protein
MVLRSRGRREGLRSGGSSAMPHYASRITRAKTDSFHRKVATKSADAEVQKTYCSKASKKRNSEELE